jgi:hypothetical protein
MAAHETKKPSINLSGQKKMKQKKFNEEQDDFSSIQMELKNNQFKK